MSQIIGGDMKWLTFCWGRMWLSDD